MRLTVAPQAIRLPSSRSPQLLHGNVAEHARGRIAAYFAVSAKSDLGGPLGHGLPARAGCVRSRRTVVLPLLRRLHGLEARVTGEPVQRVQQTSSNTCSAT